MVTTKPKNIDEYISGFPEDIRKILEQVRVTIKKAAPEAERMEAVTLRGKGTEVELFSVMNVPKSSSD